MNLMNSTATRSHLTLASLLALAAGSTAFSQVFIADSDNRQGSIQAYIDGAGEVDPIENGYNTNPGESEYIEWDLDLMVDDCDAGLGVLAEAWLDTNSAYVGWDGDYAFDSLMMNSAGGATIDLATAFDAHAHAYDNVDMSFRVEELGPDGGFFIRVQGSVDNASVEFTGPGVNKSYTDGPFSESIFIGQTGEYRLRGEGNIALQRNTPGSETESFAFNATMEIVTCSAADINNDGSVGPPDLASLLIAWGPNPGHPADFNGNGTVGHEDLALLLTEWGDC